MYATVSGQPDQALQAIHNKVVKDSLLRLISFEGGVMLRGVAVGKTDYCTYDEVIEAVGYCNVQFRGSYNTRHYISKYFAHEVRPTLMGARASGFSGTLWLKVQTWLGLAWNFTNFVRYCSLSLRV